jgi:OFA family oxalate/formate antiporter-like MFS transporter
MDLPIETTAAPRTSEARRWMQLILGIVCMVMIANYQYGWTLFVPEIEKTFGWKRPDIAIAFTLFVLWETWLVPVEGWLVDKYGPKLVVFICGLLCALGWFMTSRATTLGGLTGYYAAMIICGIGAGGVYGTCVGNALKWFPDKRGLAAGLTAAGFGIGSAFTVEPIQDMIQHSGFQNTFLYYGLGQGAIICLLAFFLASPKAGQTRAAVKSLNANAQSQRHYSPGEIIGTSTTVVLGTFLVAAALLSVFYLGLSTYFSPAIKPFVPVALTIAIILAGIVTTVRAGQPIFMLMYVMFVMVVAGGLVATANLASIANDYKIAKTDVNILGLALPALTFALTIDRFLNGITRPIFGWISDRVGRENTMFFCFLLEGIGIYALYVMGKDPFWFVILTGLVFFAWGEIYSLFPSTCTDTFGTKYASANAGLLYTAKGTGSLLLPLANLMQKDGVPMLGVPAGSWDAVLLVAAAANIVAAVLALFVLKPWRARVVAGSAQKSGYAPLPAAAE